MKELDSRMEFFESWLAEMPQRIESRNDSPSMKNTVQEWWNYYEEVPLGNDIFMLNGSTMQYFYSKNDDNAIVAIVEIEKKPHVLLVSNTGKDNSYRGKPPYITDLYLAALAQNQGTSIVLTSDNLMTDQGFAIWERLFDQGYTISVYDVTDPNSTHKKIESKEEMKQYFDANPNSIKYRFTLSESERKWFGEVRERFLLNRTRQLAGIYDLEEYFKNGGT